MHTDRSRAGLSVFISVHRWLVLCHDFPFRQRWNTSRKAMRERIIFSEILLKNLYRLFNIRIGNIAMEDHAEPGGAGRIDEDAVF